MLKVMSIIILLFPFLNGIGYFLTSKSRKLKRFARYKEKENYEYVNKLYATCYIWLGLVVAIFGTILNICYNLFWASSRRLFFCLLLVMVLEIFMDAFVNIRLQIDDYDKKNKRD